ncbi:MAG: phosphoenolpyruvate--protein phosphotransferase [Treponema sp.]|nr:phosphoenolpyruvate--protein phosphotransferase [Treponema sp.]
MQLAGKSASPGAAVGSVYIYYKEQIIPLETPIKEEEKQGHYSRYLSVKEQAKLELEEYRISLQKIDPAKAEIFKAHQEIVDDIIINEEIPARILNNLWSGDWAIYHVYDTVLAVLRQAPDPLIAERTADFEDVRSLLLRLWYGQKNEDLTSFKEPVIIAAYDLKPSDTASLDKDKVLAILTETGGQTSHTAIIARSYGIPCVLGIEGLMGLVKQGQNAAVNAAEGTVILDPDDDTKNKFLIKMNEFRLDREDAETFRFTECCISGEKIDIGVNISNTDELDAANYADMAGLFRTEFLFLGRSSLPTEEEQLACYRKVLESFGKKPVILRTLDIGADKKLPYMNIKNEENPFLGNRGLRFCLNNPDIFKTQLRAALRASVYGNLWLMLPMVSSLDCIRRAKEHIGAARDELAKEGKMSRVVKIGIMIEVPSIALICDLAAKEVDFASIGSNDLCQYLCAADRMNAQVDSYYQSYHPAMFRLIKDAAASFAKEGKPLSVCGEIAGDPLAAPVLLGLGIRKLSMGSVSIAAVKRKINSVSAEKAKEIAETVLKLPTAAEIERFLRDFN